MVYSHTPPNKPTFHPSTLIFLIPGNPGLLPYYTIFLSHLSSLLSQTSSPFPHHHHITGTSLANFSPSPTSTSTSKPLLGLEEQVTFVERALLSEIESCRMHRQEEVKGKSGRLKVIVIGHSVGAYILLEILQRVHARRNTTAEFEIIGGILLFPTVTHIAQSPSGLKASKILKLPYFALIASIIVKILVILVPSFVLCNLVKLVTGFPTEAAWTTTKFIKSPMGVRQALHMAKDEMNIITADKWQEEIWGAAASESTTPLSRPKLVLFWGRNDHWVADKTRDELIAHRGYLWSKGVRCPTREEWKPKMVLDESGIPHSFCIRHSEMVAEKVREWVSEMIEADRRSTDIGCG